jgi:hypothetical protein
VIAKSDLAQQAVGGDSSKRFHGTLKSFNMKKGFGFIECAHFQKKLNCDVFVL